MQRDLRLALADFVLLSLPQPLLVLDADGRVVEANRAAEARADIMELFDDGRKPELIELFLDDLATSGRATVEVAPSGDPATLVLEGVAIEGWFIVTIHDLAERRELEQELHLLRSRASLALVAATLVHDFNNILTPLLLLSTHLVQEVAAEAERNSRTVMIAQEIHSAAALGASLMRDVLSLSRPRAKLIERVAVNDVIVDRLGLIARLLGDSVKIECQLDEEVGDVLVDRKRFEHALLNLVANARDAMPSGGRLTISTLLVQDHDGPSVTVSIADTGVGMPEHVRARAFETFFTTKGAAGGTGIGLASVLRFARESGGRVTIESELTKGTTVIVALPRLAASELATTAAPEAPAVVAAGMAKVLVADANAMVSRAVRIALEARGYIVMVAASAERAIELAEAHQPDIALVDAQLAHHDPRTFLHRLRAAAAPLRIVFLSVAPGDGAASDFAISFLPKAFSDEELVGAVGEALGCSFGCSS